MAEEWTEGRAEDFDLEDWLEEGREGLRDVLRRKRREVLPSEFRRHTRAARREMLLAVRSLLDSAIQRFEEEEPGPPSTGATEADLS
jgi:hypothetical protein